MSRNFSSIGVLKDLIYINFSHILKLIWIDQNTLKYKIIPIMTIVPQTPCTGLGNGLTKYWQTTTLKKTSKSSPRSCDGRWMKLVKMSIILFIQIIYITHKINTLLKFKILPYLVLKLTMEKTWKLNCGGQHHLI